MRMLACMLALASLVVVSGCVMAPAAVQAPIAVDVRGPVDVGVADCGSSKTGTAKAEGIILVSFGDASINAAAADGGITKIHHVDNQVTNILGVYSKYETIVYGD